MKLAAVSIVAALALAGCAPHEPPSRIVRKAEVAGAGDLSRASLLAMQVWLEKHRVLAGELDAMCAPVRAAASAEWVDSTEGRLCLAARGVTSAAFAPVDGDHRRYQGGWK
jgi:hypothetical protein